MKTYKIIGRTNPYIAQRDIAFGGKTTIVIEKGLTLKEAYRKILDFFNSDYETCYKNWGLVRCNSSMAYSHSDGIRGYEYDSRYFEMAEEAESEKVETLEQLADFVNRHEDWMMDVEDIIERNLWTSETGDKYGICNNGAYRCVFNSSMEAVVERIED